jgi:hypothetical protein
MDFTSELDGRVQGGSELSSGPTLKPPSVTWIKFYEDVIITSSWQLEVKMKAKKYFSRPPRGEAILDTKLGTPGALFETGI